MKNVVKETMVQGELMKLKLNQERTKIVKFGNTTINGVKIQAHEFEVVENFKYL